MKTSAFCWNNNCVTFHNVLRINLKTALFLNSFNLCVLRSYNDHRTSPSTKLDFVIERVCFCDV
jgi:hypothetical protein